jgi:hypothetical protein
MSLIYQDAFCQKSLAAVESALPIFDRFFGDQRTMAPFFGEGRRGLLLEMETPAGEVDEDLLDVFTSVDPRQDMDHILGLTPSMLPALLNNSGKACFGLVSGPPDMDGHQSPLAQRLPPGLYVGNYGHEEMYRHTYTIYFLMFTRVKYAQIYTKMLIQTHTHTRMNTHAHTRAHTHTHTRTHTYLHTATQGMGNSGTKSFI